MQSFNIHAHAALTLSRLLPLIDPILTNGAPRRTFESRLQVYFPTIFRLLYELYGDRYDFYYHLEQLLIDLAHAFDERPVELHALDEQRIAQPNWFQSHDMMGAVGYVDRFAGTLAGIQAKIPYFKELGLTYLHLMPLFNSPPGKSDGGYAVSSFREVDPRLGTMPELKALMRELRANGMSLVLDFVFNHTSDEHEWAKKAQAGDEHYQAFYWMFDDRTLPDQYEPHLREIFPEQAPGCFTYRADLQKWIWTTFYPFQWDLNYRNPDVFRAMLGEILFLANQGVEVLRLDAVPFIWKQLGTNCENLPQTHIIIQALNALVRIAAPALLFKSEAIVHPRDVRSYVSGHEAQLSYNPILMVSLWEALATRDTAFMRHTLTRYFPLADDCTWINYIRSHDDIGWGFADEDAAEMGINGTDHRFFLNLFYIGRFPNSFAVGYPFNFNPRTLDMRVSGTLASLAGIEQATKQGDPHKLSLAIGRVLLVYGVLLSIGGIPLIYLGDEIGTINDYSYRGDPALAADNRWLHRPYADDIGYAQRADSTTVAGRIFLPLSQMIRARKMLPVLANGHTHFVETGNTHVLGYRRHDDLLVLANFSEREQMVMTTILATLGFETTALVDTITDQALKITNDLTLEPYQVLWLVVRRST